MTSVRTQLLLALGAGLTLAVTACGSDGPSCGDGTSEVDGACVPDSTITITCGTGTRLEGDACVPTAVPVAAPTVTAIAPALDLIGGGETFTLTGTGFSGGGNLTVKFGEVPAVFTIVNDTTITGTVPAGQARSVAVTATNAAGAASTPFRYTGLYTADGRAGVPGKLYLVDPRGTHTVALGAVAEAGGAGHGVTGLAFAPDGMLYGTEATNGGTDTNSNLLRIDPASGAATVVAPLTDSVTPTTFHHSIADITFSGTTLLGWTEDGDDACSIDTTTGVVTVLGDSANGSAGDGMVTLLDGTVVVATDGADADLWSVNTTDGTVASVATLAEASGANEEICAATMFRGTVYALLCNGSGDVFAGTRLITIDPTSGEILVIGTVSGQADALASDEPGALTAPPFVPPARPDAPEVVAATKAAAACAQTDLSVARVTRGAGQLASLRADQLATSPASITVKGNKGLVRGLPLRSAFGRTAAAVDVVSCDGGRKTLAAADLGNYVLVPNQRGHIKVVDVRTGARVARDVTALELR